MIGNIGHLETDRERSAEGIPLELDGGLTLWVRQAGGHNRRFTWNVGEIARALEAELESLDDEAERTYRLNLQVAAERLVARWEGFEDEGGSPLEYTAEAGAELFQRAPDILDSVLALATDADGYRLLQDKKKSKS